VTLSPTSKLGDHHLKACAFAMCSAKWGPNWPQHVRIFHVTLNDTQRQEPYDFMQMHEQLRLISGHVPELAVCFLYTQAHSMLCIHDRKVVVALDGQNHAQLMPLARQAYKWMQEMGFPRVDQIDEPHFWKQIDQHSCGFHLLDFLDAQLSEDILGSLGGPMPRYQAPFPNAESNKMDWSMLSNKCSKLMADHFNVGIAEQVENSKLGSTPESPEGRGFMGFYRDSL